MKPGKQCSPTILTDLSTSPILKTAKDNANFLEYARIVKAINARPKMYIRYIRESYFGANDDYARITFDRRVSARRRCGICQYRSSPWKYWPDGQPGRAAPTVRRLHL
ncbi:MAG: VTC domain-containing protein [Verrucomicrobiales bacterium]